MLGKDVYISTLTNKLQPKQWYLSDTSFMLQLEMLRKVYMLAAVNLKNTQDRQPNNVLKGSTKIQGWER